MSDTIFRNVQVEDMILAVRAVRYLSEKPETNDAILVYGEEGTNQTTFYVRRGKGSIIVRPV